MTVPTNATSADTTERAFLNNNTEISNANMMNCLVTRTNAIVDCLQVTLDNPENVTMTNNTIIEVLWQVNGKSE